MKPEHQEALKRATHQSINWLSDAFDHVADWVTQLSWWRFFLYALGALIVGGILQSQLFSSVSDEEVTVTRNHKPKKVSGHDVRIDTTGIHVKQHTDANNPPAPAPPPVPPVAASIPAAPAVPAVTPTPPVPPVGDAGKTANAAADEAIKTAALATQAAKEATQALNKAMEKINALATKADAEAEAEKASAEAEKADDDASEEAATAAAEEQVTHYRKESSKWFENFVLLLVLALFGTKALMGGKKRAEVQAEAANASAEREALHRQVSEAKMQMMQAQVEPHFLFNTLASVEYLIETDPPRASAMQRSLIKYLRAVLPQMRETALVTNLGREADIVKAYLDLLKMRMEERLTVDFQIPDGLRTAAFPPMMLQSLVENAIKHGLECKPEGGSLKVLGEVVNNKLRVSVTDDGMGFGAVPSDSTGLGLPSIRERLHLLHGDQAQLIIEPNSPSGVIAIIEVPYQLSN
jgi:signal transduction histidine kinase